MKSLIQQTVVGSWTIYLLTPLPDRQRTNQLTTQMQPVLVTNGQVRLPILFNLTLSPQQ